MVFIPGISTRRIYPRKGGGGKGGGGKSGSSGGSGGSSGGSSGKTGKSSSSQKSGSSWSSKGSTTVTGSTGGRSSTSSTSSAGNIKPYSIPAGQPFAGRQVGGGTRGQVYGNQAYGSGYPGYGGYGVAGLGFPFLFWPVVWGGGLGYGAHYLHSTDEYGDSNNSSRPGGPMQQAVLTDIGGSNNTFHILSDNSTVLSLIESIADACYLGNTSQIFPSQINNSDPTQPKPEQAVQYYRASSVVLTLDGYNNTAALSDDRSLPNVPLPSWVNGSFLSCINETIGTSVPLIDGAGALWNTPSLSLLGFIWLMVFGSLVA